VSAEPIVWRPPSAEGGPAGGDPAGTSAIPGPSGVTAALGFVAAGVACGLKASGRRDLGLLVSEHLAVAAGLFTTNRLAAAPVHACRRRLLGGSARAVVVNSGQANAGTGREGANDAEEIAAATARTRGLDPSEVLPCSTGVIGARIPVATAAAGVDAAAAAVSRAGGIDFAEAIRTTDRTAKEVAIAGDGFVVGGCAKGAGMIAPDLATLLVFLTSDAEADAATVGTALRDGAAPVWNALTVDGCSSTNDTVLLLANGASGVRPSAAELTEAVGRATRDLAAQVVADAEGSTTSLVVHVDGAASGADARAAARAVAGSLLVKTAVFGRDPNPGRILQAVGAAGVPFEPGDVDAWIAGYPVVRGGCVPGWFDPGPVASAMEAPEVVLRVRLGTGPGGATAFGCDLSYEYVRINSEYST
jgi:glutamate N-acetyltransferase/amino-acid N-acetyltransferase